MGTVFKKTPARDAITDFLEISSLPVDIEQIIAFLRTKKLKTNKVTVYRIVESLLKNEIIDRVELGEGKYRYEIKKGDHHHLVCENCGKIQDIEHNSMKSLEAEIYNKQKFLVKRHSLEFFGLCNGCQN